MFDLTRNYGARSLLLASIAAGAALLSTPAAAQHAGFHGGGSRGAFHGGYHGGYGYRGGFGWGIGVGLYDPWWPGYYGYGWYPPYGYYAEPPTTVVTTAPVMQAAPPAAAAATYYYCDNPAGYYPAVQNCSIPWRPVAIQPPQQ